MSAVNAAPLLSYIVLSYNYERHIGQTIRSIQAQSVQDFEIVVVDDASSDGSRSVIEGFGDPRIRLFVNEQNRGGAWSYNRAVAAARGPWLVNLDADDWIAAGKAQAQLDLAVSDPPLDIIGTHVAPVDEAGQRHPQAADIELHVNHQRNLNTVEAWVGRNPLCRSSTMLRRAAHLRIGLDDPAMVRAPDYELWTRALRQGCRFAVIARPLTFMRATASGVTHGDPAGTLLEMSYAMLRNLVPLAEERALAEELQAMIFWVARHDHLSALGPCRAQGLAGLFMDTPELGDYAAFQALLAALRPDDRLARIGRRCQALLAGGIAPGTVMAKLQRDIELYIEARDYWHGQARELQQAPPSNPVPSPPSERAALPPAPEDTAWTLRRLARRVSSRFSRIS